MRWSKLLVWLIAAGIVVWAIGAAVSLLTNDLLAGPNAAAAVVTLLVVAVAIVGTAVRGARSRRWVTNPRSYW